jgi:hypothetical protein
MKKVTRFAIMAMILASSTFVGCSNDESIKPSSDVVALSRSTAKKANSTEANFLGQTYNTSYTYGKSIETKDETGTKLTVTEVIVGKDTKARGYVVNKTSDNTFLYFADFDRSANTMKATNMITKEVDKVEDVDKNVFYNEVGGDMIQLIDHVNTESQYTTSSWFAWVKWTFTMDHFWGTSEVDRTGPRYDSNLNCYVTVTTVKRVFWIAWSGTRSHQEGC